MQNKRYVGAWGLNRVINNKQIMFLCVKSSGVLAKE